MIVAVVGGLLKKRNFPVPIATSFCPFLLKRLAQLALAQFLMLCVATFFARGFVHFLILREGTASRLPLGALFRKERVSWPERIGRGRVSRY